ncbi:hypothetical protein L345_15602, partial [Ophiophagus hannah]
MTEVDGGVLEEKTSAGRDPDVWHVGLKVAWDIETPGLAIPLHQGDCYFMLVFNGDPALHSRQMQGSTGEFEHRC